MLVKAAIKILSLGFFFFMAHIPPALRSALASFSSFSGYFGSPSPLLLVSFEAAVVKSGESSFHQRSKIKKDRRKKQRKRMKRGGEASFPAALLQAGKAGGFKIGS